MREGATQRSGQRIGPLVDLAEGKLAEFVDDGRSLGAASRGQRDADGVGRAFPAERGGHPDILVRPQAHQQPGASHRAKGKA